MPMNLDERTARLLEKIRAYPDAYRGENVIVDFFFDTKLQPALKRKRCELWGLEHNVFSMAEVRLCDGKMWFVVFNSAMGRQLIDERPVCVKAQAIVLVDRPDSDQQEIGLQVINIETRKPPPKGLWGQFRALLRKIPITH